MSRNRSIRRAERKLIVPSRPRAPASTEIPFIRSFANGTTRLTTVDRGEELYGLACQFIAAGGRYMVMKMDDGAVELVAALGNGAGNEPTGVACETTEDGPPMLDAIDRLVRDSVARLDVLQ
jgi:hypothetical protein